MDQAEQWASCVPGNDLHDWGSSMLTRSILPSRTEYDDFRDIDFTRALFATRQTAKLSMALSEVADADTVPIRHSYDIDSTVLLLKSLAALRGAMDMSYYPHYFASLREPVRFDVQVNGQPVHKMKNVMLGEPIMGPKNMRINVFFPFLPLGRTKEQYLSKLEFQHWVDGVQMPSVAAVAPPDVLQHYPHTWDAAHAQSQTAREANIGPVKQVRRAGRSPGAAVGRDCAAERALRDGRRRRLPPADAGLPARQQTGVPREHAQARRTHVHGPLPGRLRHRLCGPGRVY
jgi:hypothetical protein